MADDDLVTWERDGEVALIGLNRPAKRNAISDALLAALDAAVARAGVEARAAVIFGHGAHFSAGLDLSEHAERSQFEGLLHSRAWHAVFRRIEAGPIPVVAALHGAVVGGGLELAAAAHIRVADATAFFALPEGSRGIFLGGGGAVRITRLCGTARVTDLMLTGRSVTAREAEAWNLVQYAVPKGEALARARALAAKAAGNALTSNFAIIHALPAIAGMDRESGLLAESFVAAFASASPEAAERLRAFLDKRAAKVAVPEAD